MSFSNSTCKLYGISIHLKVIVWSGIQNIFGINKSRSLFINYCVGIGEDFYFYQLIGESIFGLRCVYQAVPISWLFENSLRQFLYRSFYNFFLSRSYKYHRYQCGLPCRGQRTNTNARTVRSIQKNCKV